MGYETIEECYDDIMPYDEKDLKVHLCSSSILTLMAHGAPLKVEMSDGSEVTYLDIMEMSPNCLSDLELVVLASCYTGAGYPNSSPPQNFAEALAAQGAQNVVAFRDAVACAQVIPWLCEFYASLARGNTYEEAFDNADSCVAALYGSDETVVITTDAEHRVFITME